MHKPIRERDFVFQDGGKDLSKFFAHGSLILCTTLEKELTRYMNHVHKRSQQEGKPYEDTYACRRNYFCPVDQWSQWVNALNGFFALS